MKVLFVCVGNSCRSQMAEGFARHFGLLAESAGTEPASAVSRTAVAVMAEKGIDLTTHTPKTLDWTSLKEFDRTITMGCGVAESCPALRTDEDWGLDDPVGQPIEVFRAVRDDIERRVLALKEALESHE
jgi:arsenate reductase (thioredoxin)